ncbi:uncharacterized protein F5891DRAFT_987252 [Suillus fuscotomentosus]|uniref:Uncharacterized protein n=1 Tax=Suillus fuscotomentosus TaxID=1912939 RepID=A0AAD4DQP5_9AGAM|nr:uncharacterized protein F5891DRAFT_987252 [Suillus fuscotomentosus]KAG1889759.1 hypothetical protein F5891DRAFT_987252 [Suillus fuscotomentosus]
MFGKQVRFATAVYSDDDDSVTSATSDSSYVNSSDSLRSTRSDSPEVAQHKFEGPLAWWCGYTPLDSWIPPVLSQIPRFKGLIGVEPYIRFKQYNLADEVQLSQEWTNDPIANRDIRYDMCFFGEFDEVTSMLADIHVLDMTHGTAIAAKAIPRSRGLTNLDWSPLSLTQVNSGSVDEPMHEDKGPDRAADDTAGSLTMDPYDCGWEDAPAAEDILSSLFSGEQADPYDCGWDDRMEVDTPGVKEDSNNFEREDESKNGLVPGLPMVEEEDAYDCGWEDAVDAQPTASSMTIGHQDDPYDCGWEHRPDDGAGLTDSVMTVECAEDPYDCGWSNQQDDGAAFISSVATEDLYDCRWEEEKDPDSASPVAIPEDPYDCGWGSDADNQDIASRHDPQNGQIGRWTNSPTPMDGLYIIDLTSSSGSPKSTRDARYGPMSIEIPEVIDLTSDAGSCSAYSHGVSQRNTFQEASLSMHRAIQRLNNIGTDQRNASTQNMVKQNPAGMPDSLPAATLRANQRLIGAYADVRDRVTELGEDVVAIYRLLDIHRRIMDPLDAMITNLQQGDR